MLEIMLDATITLEKLMKVIDISEKVRRATTDLAPKVTNDPPG